MNLSRKRLSLQFALKIKIPSENPVYHAMFKPNDEELYDRKPKIIPSVGIRIKQDLNKICSNENKIVKSTLPEIPPLWYSTPEINFRLALNKIRQILCFG